MTANEDEDEQFRARVGSVLRGKWTIDALLGVGGMAAVYSATNKIGRRAAIKILHPEVAVSKELRARFEQEALAVNQLGHPGTVSIYDIDTTEQGAPFMAMELLQGESLGQLAHRLGDMPERQLLEIMRVVLEVLEAAHERGIVHRDIKPDNLFVTASGAAKVLDFGIARMKQGGSNVRTRTGAMLGTTPYMPPEQISGGTVDGRSDVFAVGATMFRILAKRRIHETSTDAELLIKMATEPAPPLRSVAPQVGADTAGIIDAALAFDVTRRPSARALREDITRVLRGERSNYAAAASTAQDPTRAGHRAPDPPTSAPMSAGIRVGAPSSKETGAMVDAPTMFAMPSPASNAQAAPKSTSTPLIIAVAVSLLVGVGGTIAFFALRDDPKTETRKSDDDDEDDVAVRKPTKPTASATPPKTASATTPAVPSGDEDVAPATPNAGNDTYRLLEKKGGYLFCVTSGLKQAYIVKSDDDGNKYCSDTPDGPVPIDGLKKYSVSEVHWQ